MLFIFNYVNEGMSVYIRQQLTVLQLPSKIYK